MFAAYEARSSRVPAVPVSQLAVAVAVLLLAAVLWVASHRWYVRLRLRRKWAHARSVELQAARLLVDSGYTLLGDQVETRYAVFVDGKSTEIRLRADYLVSRAGRQFVAEVKSGLVAPRLDTAATRRQLLEYLVAFKVDGVLLVDGEEREVHEVTFPMSRTPARDVSAARLAIYVAMAVLVAFGLWMLSRGL